MSDSNLEDKNKSLEVVPALAVDATDGVADEVAVANATTGDDDVHAAAPQSDETTARDKVKVGSPTQKDTSSSPTKQQPSGQQPSSSSMDEAIEKLVPMRSDAFLSRVRSDDPGVVELILRGSYVTAATVNMIGDALLSNRRVVRIDLSSNNLADADVVHLINVGIRGNKGVKELVLADNPDITDATFKLITEVLLDDNNTLTHVDANGTGVTPVAWRHFNRLSALNSFPVELKRQLFAAGQDDPNLFVIRLQYDASDPKVYNAASTRALAEVLGAQRKQQDGSTSQTPVGSPRRNVLGLIEGIETGLEPPINNVVRQLYLGGCCRGEACVRELLPILATNPRISRVHLDHNYIGDEAVEMICSAIIKAGANSGLEELVLDHNEITNDGAKKIIEMLQVNTTIKSVSLLHNPRLTSPTLQEQLRIEMALNCEPSSMRPAIEKIREGLPENLSRDAEKQLYMRQKIGEMLNPTGILDLCGTPDDDGKGPAKGYYTSLGATTISLALRANISIHTVNFRNNHIGPQGAKAISDLLEFNPTIVRLDLSENPITDEGARHLLNAFATNDALVTLNLEDSDVSERLRNEIRAACHLNSQPEPIKDVLRVREYEFTGHADTNDATSTDEGVVLLNLSRRPVQVRGKWKGLHPESAQYIVTILKKQPHITHLDLSDNDSLGDEGVAILREWLVHPKCNLRKINLSNTGISDVSVALLAQSLRANYSLLNVIVAANPNITTRPRQDLEEAVSLNRFPTKVKDLIPILSANVQGVNSVDFSREPDLYYKERNLPIPSPLGDDTAKLLFTALVRNTHVTSVRLRNQGIGNRGIGYLVECLSVNENITLVDLSYNMVGSEGASELASLLDRNVTLRSIDLGHNGISEDGAVALLFSMNTANRTVTYLNLAGCSAVSASTRHKIECLASFNTQSVPFRRHILERISSISYVRCNGHPDSTHYIGGVVDDDAVGALAMALNAQPHKVQSIELVNNIVTDVGCRILLEQVLPNHPTITHVNLCNNPLSDEGGIEINAYLQEHRHMQEFKVGNIPIEVSKSKKLNSRDLYQDTTKRPNQGAVVETTYSAAACRCKMSAQAVKRVTITGALNRAPLAFQRAYTQLEGKLVQWYNLKEQLLTKVRKEEEVNSPANIKHKVREQQRRESQQRLLTESNSTFIDAEGASTSTTAAAPTRKSELLTTINKVVPAAVNFSRTEMTGVELRLLCDLLEHFDVFGSKTLRGLQLSDNPGLDDNAIRKLVVEYLLPNCGDSLQALHLDRTGLSDASSLLPTTATITTDGAADSTSLSASLLPPPQQSSVMEVLAKLASTSQTIVSLSYTGTPLARVLKAHARNASGSSNGDPHEDSADHSDPRSNPHQLAMLAEDLAKYDTNALDYAQQLQDVITKALDRNRGRLVGSATDEFFADRTSMVHPYGRGQLMQANGGVGLMDAAPRDRRNSQGIADPAAALLPVTPAELRDEADAILADAMRGAPARSPYTRGRYAPQ